VIGDFGSANYVRCLLTFTGGKSSDSKRAIKSYAAANLTIVNIDF